MPNTSNMREIITHLTNKTKEQQICWELAPRLDVARIQAISQQQVTSVAISSFIARFLYSVVRVQSVETDNTLTSAQFLVEERDGRIFSEWTIFRNDNESTWEICRELIRLLNEQCSASAFTRIMEQIERSEQTEVSDSYTTQDDLATQFFNRIAGSWHLTYYRGNKGYPEDCKIDGDGNYFIGKTATKPYFHLKDVFYDPDENNVSFAKVEAMGPKRGKTRQVEILRIDPKGQWMMGYAQHDRHELKYVRLDTN